MQRPIPQLQNRLLAALPADELARLSPHLSAVELDRGRTICEPGDPIEQAYFPVTGVISLMTLMESGAAIESAMIGPEGAFGLAAAAAPRVAQGRAVVQSPLRAYRIGIGPLHEFWLTSATLRQLADRHGEGLYAHAAQSVACNALHSVEERFCRWLLSCHDRIHGDTLALTQEFLADMLGVQRTTVTAVARSLQEKGAIRYRRGQVDIIDRSVLEAGACECYGVVRRAYDRLIPPSSQEVRAETAAQL
ncbi:MAG: Crp/Fnr family transcriptional regulator [Pseudomonadota bacterium]